MLAAPPFRARLAQTLAAAAAVALWAGCSPAKAPEPAAQLRVGSLNIANGAGDVYRSPQVRPRQRALLGGLGVVAFQEVDVGVERSGRVDTALAVAGEGFGGCEAAPLSPEGLRRCDGDGGTLLFGLGFRGDDTFGADPSGLPSGIIDGDSSLNPTSVDRSSSALFGNALLLRGLALESAVVVALPIDAAPPSAALYGALARATAAERAAHNLAVRSSPGIEPRSLLVARLALSGASALSVLATHLESGGAASLRVAQLLAAAQVAKGERDQGRRVVLLGDLNMNPGEASQVLAEFGLVRAVGETADQVWVDPMLAATQARELPTEGASDHPFLPSVTLR